MYKIIIFGHPIEKNCNELEIKTEFYHIDKHSPQQSKQTKTMVNNCIRCGYTHLINNCFTYGKNSNKRKSKNNFSDLCTLNQGTDNKISVNTKKNILSKLLSINQVKIKETDNKK